MSKLELIDLSNNHLQEFPEAVLLSTIQLIKLTRNTGRNQPIETFRLFQNKFTQNNSITELHLSKNRISKIEENTFTGLTKLKFLNLRNCSISSIHQNGLHDFISLNTLILYGNELTHITFGQFDNLGELRLLSLEHNKLMLRTCEFQSLINLEKLNLAHNVIDTIPSNCFSDLKNLKYLDVSHNKIQTLKNSILPESGPLEFMGLNNNSLKMIHGNIVNDIKNVRNLDLTGNQFSCVCDLSTFVSFHVEKYNLSQMNSTRKAALTCSNPKNLETKLLHDYHHEMLADCKLDLVLLGCLVGASILLLVIFCVLIRFYIWHIRYLWFRIRIKFHRCYSTAKSEKEKNYIYDAFVSYNHCDSDIAMTIAKTLETSEHQLKPGLKFCLYERDFMAGKVLTEAITDSIASSDKFILILTEKFLESHWCLWELQLIHHIVFHEDRLNSLILIKFGDLPQNKITPTCFLINRALSM